MLATVPSASVLGASGFAVTVEAHVSDGLPSFSIVGLPDETCRESHNRVRAAVAACSLSWPMRRITVNLAPSHVRKGGSALDLAMAVAVLVASEQIPAASIDGLAFIGELGLDGSLRSMPGVAPMVHALDGALQPVVPVAGRAEALVAARQPVRAIGRLADLVACLRGEQGWPPDPPAAPAASPPTQPDLRDVRGQRVARLAMEVAAAGGHHLFLIGPPGAGKTMLAERLPSILPDLDDDDALAATMIHSAAGVGLPPSGLVRQPPFHAPHHDASMAALVGGGSHTLRPGEASLAHRGVLFLDEMGEFGAVALDALRQPLEDGVVRVARAKASVVMPARFLLIGASNPCPCGGGPPGACACTPSRRERYLRRLSGPLLDRFDLRVVVQRPSVDELLDRDDAEPSAVVALRITRARRLAAERQGCLNAAVAGPSLDDVARLAPAAAALLRHELEHDRLSGRGYHRVRRVARTLADLAVGPGGAADDGVDEEFVAIALRMRSQVGSWATGRAA